MNETKTVEQKSKEEQKISDDKNHSLGYFIQSVETKANNYIITRYQPLFDDFVDRLKEKLKLERTSRGYGLKIEADTKALNLIEGISKKFREFREILKPSIVEGFIDEIMDLNEDFKVKDD